MSDDALHTERAATVPTAIPRLRQWVVGMFRFQITGGNLSFSEPDFLVPYRESVRLYRDSGLV
jgi:hypothetical protein